MADGFPKAPLPANTTESVTLTLVDASPLSSRNQVSARSLGDGYRASFTLGNPGDDAALNSLCKKRRVFLGSTHIENVDQLREAILAT